MTRKSRALEVKWLVTALLMSLLPLASSDAQSSLAAYEGRFTLTQPIQWNTTTLPPGNYTVTIETTGTPNLALIRMASGRPVARVRSWSRSERTNAKNALLLKEKNGRLQVQSLALGDLGMVLIYEPAGARETHRDEEVSRTVLVESAKR